MLTVQNHEMWDIGKKMLPVCFNTIVPDLLEKSDLFRKHSEAGKGFETNKGKGNTVLKHPNITTFLGNRKKIYEEKNS